MALSPATSPPRRPVGRPRAGEDLRAALLETTLRLLERTGDPAIVTVAAIVDEVGCTAPTLYHYFGKRDTLVGEASAHGFAEFRQTQALTVGTETDPIERLRLRGRAYLAFALTRPSLFRVLFLDRPVPAAPGADVENPGQGLQDLVDDVAAAMERGELARADPLVVAAGLWAGVHGVAALWTATPELPHDLAFVVADAQTDALLAGYASAVVARDGA